MASVARAVISFHTFHLHGAQRGLVQGHTPGGRQGACGTRAEVLVNGEKMNQLKLILLLMIPPDSSDSVFSGYSSALGSGTAQILLGPSTAIFCKNCRQKHHMTERFFFPTRKTRERIPVPLPNTYRGEALVYTKQETCTGIFLQKCFLFGQ